MRGSCIAFSMITWIVCISIITHIIITCQGRESFFVFPASLNVRPDLRLMKVKIVSDQHATPARKRFIDYELVCVVATDP